MISHPALASSVWRASSCALLTCIVGCTFRSAPVLVPVRVDTAAARPSVMVSTITQPAISNYDELFRRFDHPDWPSPGSIRTASGAPGSAYWQQRADYTIAAALDTGSRTLRGTVSIRYTNNSPDSLRFIWLQLDQNRYRAGSKGSALMPEANATRMSDGGFELTGLQVNGRGTAGKVDDTMMRIDLDVPVAPRGGTLVVGLQYSFRIPDQGSDRPGRDGTRYEVARWYPRLAVYDDVRGWNTDPYLGSGDAYLDYGDFEYSVTVPAGYVVAGSGALQNRTEVLTRAQIERLDQAATSAGVVPVITADEAAATPRQNAGGFKTWRFRASDVREVAWAAAPDFRWDATNWSGVLVQSFYPWPRSPRSWLAAAEETRSAIHLYSQLLVTYPYPQATTVAGLSGAAVYPMLAMVPYGADSLALAIDRAQANEWFPTVIGSNGRKYVWMGDGLAAYETAFAAERRAPGVNVFPSYLDAWRTAVAEGTQAPVMTPPDRLSEPGAGTVTRAKPGALLLALRNGVLDREVMDRALREYARRWAFRHPTPADFFRTVESVSGQDLSWFWRGFFYGTGVLDIAVDGLLMRQGAGERLAEVRLRRVTDVPFPVSMRLYFNDASWRDVRLPVEIWARSDRYTAVIPVARPVVGVRLWPEGSVPDWNSGNDAWGEAPVPERPPSTAGGSAPPIPAPPSKG